MKVTLAKYDETGIGGGWQFCRNFIKAFSTPKDMDDVIITSDYVEADIFFIPSASMVSREEVLKAKEDGKKIILRCDNVIRNSRNRNSGMTRMKDFSDWADLVIFQSHFAESLLNAYLQTENYKVIMNSADETVFNPKGRVKRKHDNYLYSRYSSDETKNWEMARSAYQEIHTRWADSEFYIVGRPDMTEHNFDFYNGEKIKYWGLIQDSNTLAEIYRQSDKFLYTYFNDAASNTLIEALLCGVEIVDCYGMIATGGAPEIAASWYSHGAEYFHLERMGQEYKEAFNVVLS